MKKPIIGLTPQGDTKKGAYRMSPDFISGLSALGAIPIVLPSVIDNDDILREAISLCDGIILTGGPDVRPELFGEQIIPACGEISDERDAFEIKLYKMAIEADKPILGICRGAQVMNIAAGGNIYQDIYSQTGTMLAHHTLDGVKSFHNVSITNKDALEKMKFSDVEFVVNSYHHQSVKDLGEGYEAVAYSPDGLIEAIYMPSRRFVVGVQWHPEKRFSEDDNSARMLIDFVESCKK